MISRRAPGRVFAGLWEFPGGKIEPGERPEQAACREAMEEVGLVVETRAHLGSIDTAHGGASVRLHLLHCQLVGGDAIPTDGSVETVRWATLRELGSLEMPPANRQIIALLGDLFPGGEI